MQAEITSHDEKDVLDGVVDEDEEHGWDSNGEIAFYAEVCPDSGVAYAY